MNTMYYMLCRDYPIIKPGEEGMDYEQGLTELEKLLRDTTLENDFLTYEARLRENLHKEQLYGSTEQTRANSAQIIDQLNRLAKNVGTSFNALCRPGNNLKLQT